MPLNDPELMKIVMDRALDKKICRRCGATNPPGAIKCRRCKSYDLRSRKLRFGGKKIK
ncbi:MAG: 50S ribosomal protein L40e [Desulfurococcales archaeon]|jgi:large subunit ribosomal protein L40e